MPWRRNEKGKTPVLIAEDDGNEAFFLRRAFEKECIGLECYIVSDGSEAIQYIQGEGQYANRELFPEPLVLILDLKMPKVGGFDVLKWVREHPQCAVIPTIVLSSSFLDQDVKKAYQLGANAYFTKRPDFNEYKKVLSMICAFWNAAELPPPH